MLCGELCECRGALETDEAAVGAKALKFSKVIGDETFGFVPISRGHLLAFGNERHLLPADVAVVAEITPETIAPLIDANGAVTTRFSRSPEEQICEIVTDSCYN